MSNIVEPYISKTESTSLFDKFNNLPNKGQPITVFLPTTVHKEQYEKAQQSAGSGAKSNTGLYVGLGVGGVVILGLIVYLAVKK